MSPLEAFRDYVALKRHFSDWAYDYQRYGPAAVSPETFEGRSDAFRFRQLCQRPYPQWTMISTLAFNEDAWVGNMLGEEAEERRDRSIGRLQAVARTLEAELDRFSGNPLVPPSWGKIPPLAREVLGGRVSLETGSILMGFSGYSPRWKEWFRGDPAMESLTRRLARYFPLMPIDRKKAGSVVYSVMMTKYR